MVCRQGADVGSSARSINIIIDCSFYFVKTFFGYKKQYFTLILRKNGD